MAQIDKYSRMQILLSGHKNRFARMQNLRIRKLRFALGLDQVQNLRIFCVYAKVEKLRSHGQICLREQFANTQNLHT